MVDLLIKLKFDGRGLHLIVPVEVGEHLILDMVLDTGSPASSISERTRDSLLNTRHLDPLGNDWYRLRDLRIQSQPIPDLQVRVTRRTSKVGIQGIIGLPFFGQFSELHVDIPNLLMRLSWTERSEPM